MGPPLKKKKEESVKLPRIKFLLLMQISLFCLNFLGLHDPCHACSLAVRISSLVHVCNAADQTDRELSCK